MKAYVFAVLAAVCLTCVLSSGVMAQQNLRLKAAAEEAGFGYQYDRFEESETVRIVFDMPDGGALAWAYYRKKKDWHFALIAIPKSRGALISGRGDLPAIFLIDGRRVVLSQDHRNYEAFSCTVGDSQLREMVEAKSLACKIAGVEMEFTPEQQKQMRKLMEVVELK